MIVSPLIRTPRAPRKKSQAYRGQQTQSAAQSEAEQDVGGTLSEPEPTSFRRGDSDDEDTSFRTPEGDIIRETPPFSLDARLSDDEAVPDLYIAAAWAEFKRKAELLARRSDLLGTQRLNNTPRTPGNTTSESSLTISESEREINLRPDEEDEMSHTQMPARGARGAPSFLPTEPEELPRYFQDLEDWFVKANKKEDNDKREYILRYIPAKTEEEWRNLDGFETKKYEELKEMILNEYPAAVSIKTGSLSRLTQICKEHQRLSEDDLQELLNYKRAFMAEAKKLTAAPTLLANHTLVTAFVSCLTTGFRDRLFQKLDMDFSTSSTFEKWLVEREVAHKKLESKIVPCTEDKYELEKVVRMAETMARTSNPGATLAFGKEGIAEMVPDRPVKTEPADVVRLQRDMTDMSSALATLMDSVKLAQKSHKEQLDGSEKMVKQLLEEWKREKQLANTRVPTILQPPPPPPPQPVWAGQQMYAPPVVTRQYNYPPPAGRVCFYCKLPGHMVAECMVKQQDLDTGRLRMEGTRFQYPDGTPVQFDAARSVKERVDEWHSKQKGPAAAQAYNAKQPGVIYMQHHQGTAPSGNLEDVVASMQHELAQYRNHAPRQDELIEEQRRELANLKSEIIEMSNQDFEQV